MKLDYLQFLELEVFTRFGARLEASMEAAIQRGRLLRELLKQERLTPVPARLQLAWMIAFNEGLVDMQQKAGGDSLIAVLEQAVDSTLDLDTPREQWCAALKRILADNKTVPS